MRTAPFCLVIQLLIMLSKPKRTNKQVEIIVFRKNKNKKIEFLVLKRNKERGGFWQPLTGGVEQGESLREALMRELYEETGIKDVKEIIDVEYNFSFGEGKKKQYEYVFGVEVSNDSKIILSEEHDDMTWVSKDKTLEKYLVWDGNREGLKRLHKKIISL